MKQQLTLKIKDLKAIKRQLLAYSELFDFCNFYDSNETMAPLQYGRFELLAGFGCITTIDGDFEEITSQIEHSSDWIFGYLSYESYQKFGNKKKLDKVEANFYKPQIVFSIRHGSDTMTIENNGVISDVFTELSQVFLDLPPAEDIILNSGLQFNPCTPKYEYLENISNIKTDILNGTYYELNYCQKFEHLGHIQSPVTTFKAINMRSPTPFAAFIKNKAFHILCTSPERFIYKNANTLISQPIKGTNKRLAGNMNENQLAALKNSEKEIAENVMIVDLVRNDMAKIAEKGSVEVEELCGTYPFALVNQMISTIKSTLIQGTTFAEILKSLFPMGSMTGAPKIEVMKHITIYEKAKRNLYSGCIGYRMPNGDFDFNVVIRTLVEDRLNNIVSYHVGGAITYDSVPENEYEECLLKADGLTGI